MAAKRVRVQPFKSEAEIVQTLPLEVGFFLNYRLGVKIKEHHELEAFSYNW